MKNALTELKNNVLDHIRFLGFSESRAADLSDGIARMATDLALFDKTPDNISVGEIVTRLNKTLFGDTKDLPATPE